MMRLVVSFSGKVLNRLEFEKGPVCVGRSQECEVHIDNLGVSRRHCEIVRDGRVFVVRDLKSNNGTFVNGRRVTAHNLNSGDEISIGKYSIGFSSADEPPPEPAKKKVEEEEEDGDIGGMTMAIDARQMALIQREKASRVKGYLVFNEGKVRRELFLEKSVYQVGKGKECDLRTSGWFAPRKHAVIFRDDTGFRLIDVSPKGKGVLINQKAIDDERLKDGDHLTIGDRHFQFMSGTPAG